MLSPDTASNDASVWKIVRRAEFEKNVSGLRRENDVPAMSHIYPLDDFAPRKSHQDYALLTLDIEKELADDVAFIAACEEGAYTVTACTIEASSDNLRFILAANEGIQPHVEDVVKSILSTLERCAQRSIAEMSTYLEYHFVD